jgi:hypothetical protein
VPADLFGNQTGCRNGSHRRQLRANPQEQNASSASDIRCSWRVGRWPIRNSFVTRAVPRRPIVLGRPEKVQCVLPVGAQMWPMRGTYLSPSPSPINSRKSRPPGA